MTWQLHPQLLADCYELMTHQEIHILLKKEKIIPWVILVPKTAQRDLCDLEAESFAHLLGQMKKISQYLKQKFSADKINVAEIGNVVPQMHVHILARKQQDACWPGVVWGKTLDAATYSTEEVTMMQQEMIQLFGEVV